MSPEPITFELNEHQRRHFAVILASLENALEEIVALAAHDASDGRHLTELAHDIPEGYYQRVRPAIDAIRTQLVQLAEAMQVEPHLQSKGRTIRAMLTAQINQLQDSYARTLKRYGAVDPHLASALDPRLEAIEQALTEMRAALRAGGSR